MDSEYLKQKLCKCLVEGLAEVTEQRPADPIEFLAQWIFKYRENLQRAQERAAYEKQLAEALEKAREEELHQKRLREEEERIRAEQELKEEVVSTPPPTPLLERPRKVNPPTMETVQEDGDKPDTATTEPVAPLHAEAPVAPPEANSAAELQPEENAEHPPDQPHSLEEDGVSLVDPAASEHPSNVERTPSRVETEEVPRPGDPEQGSMERDPDRAQLPDTDDTVSQNADDAEVKSDESASEVHAAVPVSPSQQPEEERADDDSAQAPLNPVHTLSEEEPANLEYSSAAPEAQGPSDPENPDPNISEDQPVAELEDSDPHPEETQPT